MIEDIAFTAQADGTEQRYVLIFPDQFAPRTRHDVLVALHGHGSDRWQFVRDPRDECRAARDMAAARDMLFVSPDYRAPTSWMGPRAEADILEILDALGQTYAIGRVFLCGGSMGGTASLTFASLHPERIAGVASMNGTANLLEFEGFADAIRDSFGGTKADIPEVYRQRSAEFRPARLTMPVGLAVGGQDRVVPPQSVLRLAEQLAALRPDVLLIYREDGGHSTSYADAKAVLEFVVQRADTLG